MYQEVCSHSHHKTFICEETLEFMLEHLRGKDREPTAVRTKDFACRYEGISRQLRSYARGLRESIPLWAQFTELHGALLKHLGEGRSQLGSSNASTFLSTQRSLGVAKVRWEDVGVAKTRWEDVGVAIYHYYDVICVCSCC